MTMAGMDAADPLVAVIAWALTALLRRWTPDGWGWLRKATPAIAMLVAVFVRTIWGILESGEVVTADLVLHGVTAGALAVWGHSQFREVLKVSSDADAPTTDGHDSGS